MADHYVLDPQFFLLELVKADVIGMGAVFLFVDERLELGMLCFEGLDLGLVHRRHSFRSVDDNNAVNHETAVLSRTLQSPCRPVRAVGRGEMTPILNCATIPPMNDDDPRQVLELLKAEHRRLDEEIHAMREQGAADQLEIARLKKRKLLLKDEIAVLNDRIVPDITA